MMRLDASSSKLKETSQNYEKSRVRMSCDSPLHNKSCFDNGSQIKHPEYSSNSGRKSSSKKMNED